MGKRLYRSKKERMFLGVLGGIAEYLEIDPTIIRIIYILLLIASAGTAILLYFLLAIVMPEEPGEEVTFEKIPGKVEKIIKEVDETIDSVTKKDIEELKNIKIAEKDDTKFFALILILLGFALIASNLNIFMPWFSFKVLSALVLILFGIYLLVRG
ncbi:hypothetical protein PAP_05575 [Palaeococcus pacificus DY20341]|uniref:Phage shock protein PspC N-terminal domain-containing protein n=1 Tax=Palaeococcus pacificus DY20341 TaxID=1343739 RepID=A0A075LY54_9EURY|nr:PspC domain-containing protein [Palaeococcus pacificus]AIF69518.1 hypothetical protein PAP_05575 [Palaeococcus pacificus DY20341]